MKAAAILHPAVDALWSGAFFVVGVLARDATPRMEFSGGQNILVVAPHPDDEVVGCGGAILSHVQCGDRVSIAYVTDGSMSRAGGLSPERMGFVRKDEAGTAAQLLGVDQHRWFGLPEGRWTLEQLIPLLVRVLQQSSPQVIYAPSRVDFHPEHHKVAHGLARALSELRSTFSATTVRICQLQVPLTPVLTNRVGDCSDAEDEFSAVLQVYASQSANLERALRMRRYAARRHGLRKQGEEFWEISAAAYRRLHSSPPEHWRTICFRGLRYRPFWDPLSYLSGAGERRRLKKCVAAPEPGF